MKLINDPFGSIRDNNMYLLLCCGMLLALAILFLQSGLDKVTDHKGNREWLTGHFSKSPLRNMVPFMLITLTILEMASGLACVAGIVLLAGKHDLMFARIGVILSLFTLICLFAGQRIAKDYPGAASLIGYMTFTAVAAYVMMS